MSKSNLTHYLSNAPLCVDPKVYAVMKCWEKTKFNEENTSNPVAEAVFFTLHVEVDLVLVYM